MQGVPGSRHLAREQHGAQVSHRLVAARLQAVQRQSCGGGWRRVQRRARGRLKQACL